jgi:hypothetical protein
MRKVECSNDYTSVATFAIDNGRNGLCFRIDGDKVLVDLSLAPGPMFSSMTLDSLREDLERNSMSLRDMDDILDGMAEKVYTSLIARRLSENIKRG